MFRTELASSRSVRLGVFGLVTLAALATCDSAEARRFRHHHHAQRSQHDEEQGRYNPQFSSIVVDGNSGATLTASSPDASRHPASLTKIMTLYLLFERLEAGKMKLDTEMQVSEFASEQAPTKLGLHPGQTIRVEDAIKGLVTRSANDAAVVIAEAIGGNENEFAKLMTRKARALGMTRTLYRNASGLPDDEQVTTARDQSTLGRAIQDRFPRYYRYFSTVAFSYHGQSIRNHNHLLGNLEGVDGIKTGYTRASGFNLVTSMRRGNRHLIGVVMGGRSGGSRDAMMRTLLAENLEKASTRRTVAAITEHSSAETNVADAGAEVDSTQAGQVEGADQGALQAAPAKSEAAASSPARPITSASRTSIISAAAAAMPPAPLTSGVIQAHAIAAIPGSSEPMKPVKVKTVQVKAGQLKLASAAPGQSGTAMTGAISPSRSEVPESSKAIVARAETAKPDPAKPELGKTEPAASELGKTELAKPEFAKSDAVKTNFVKTDIRTDLPPQPAGHGTGNGLLGVLPASSVPPGSTSQTLAYAATASQQYLQPQSMAQKSTVKLAAPVTPTVRTGWIVQVGALESESEAHQRIEAARSSARGLLTKADPFTEQVVAKDNKTLFRARFAGLDRDQAEAVCRTLKRADISCITVHN
jgi:D-alanyl-D-alanine carboxypeptidase